MIFCIISPVVVPEKLLSSVEGTGVGVLTILLPASIFSIQSLNDFFMSLSCFLKWRIIYTYHICFRIYRYHIFLTQSPGFINEKVSFGKLMALRL